MGEPAIGESGETAAARRYPTLAEQLDEERTAGPTATWLDELTRTADALRGTIAALAVSRAPAADLARVARLLDDVTHALTTAPVDHALPRRGGRTFLDASPVVGRTNPLAPPVVLRREGDTVVGDVTFTRVHEGPPGRVHGGLIAATFDDVLGVASSLPGRNAVTVSLSVRFRAPTPMGRPLRFVARVAGVAGRKVTVVGSCTLDDGTITAEAEGLFVTLDEDTFAGFARAAHPLPEA